MDIKEQGISVVGTGQSGLIEKDGKLIVNMPNKYGAELRKTVVLTDAEIETIRDDIWNSVVSDDEYDKADLSFARAILAAAGAQ